MLNRRAFLQTGSHLCASAMAVSAMAVAAQPCATARGVGEDDFVDKNAQFTNPQLTAETMTWATKVIVV